MAARPQKSHLPPINFHHLFISFLKEISFFLKENYFLKILKVKFHRLSKKIELGDVASFTTVGSAFPDLTYNPIIPSVDHQLTTTLLSQINLLVTVFYSLQEPSITFQAANLLTYFFAVWCYFL